MIDIKIEIDDKQIMDFCKKSPKRAEWALSEALKKAGGHYRKKMRAFIEGGGKGNWSPLSKVTKDIRSQPDKNPLHGFAQLVRFKYGKSKGIQRVRIGFFGKRRAKLARELGYGRRFKVTEKIKLLFAYHGYFLKKITKYIILPARPIIDPFWKKNKSTTAGYIEKNFFEKFFSKEKTKLKF